MWDKLLSIFEQRTEQRQDRLFNKFSGIKEKDPLESVAKHMAKLEKFWVELQDETWKEDKVELPESLFMNRVLNTLPKEYFEFLNAWESVAKQQRTIQLLRKDYALWKCGSKDGKKTANCLVKQRCSFKEFPRTMSFETINF
ncbi:hypothetical protein JTB14_004594 [Gonioctena quinquepunctata]|nr:hypothetical protein JTB14_004594 [Gonioctena quinquepunctata]